MEGGGLVCVRVKSRQADRSERGRGARTEILQMEKLAAERK